MPCDCSPGDSWAICHKKRPLDLSCNGIQRTHSSTPFLVLGCQCCQNHLTAFLALDLAGLFEVIYALAHTAVRLGVAVVECANIRQLSSFLSWRTRTCRSVAPLLSSDNVLLVT